MLLVLVSITSSSRHNTNVLEVLSNSVWAVKLCSQQNPPAFNRCCFRGYTCGPHEPSIKWVHIPRERGTLGRRARKYREIRRCRKTKAATGKCGCDAASHFHYFSNLLLLVTNTMDCCTAVLTEYG